LSSSTTRIHDFAPKPWLLGGRQPIILRRSISRPCRRIDSSARGHGSDGADQPA
jgi:hypothetical protein